MCGQKILCRASENNAVSGGNLLANECYQDISLCQPRAWYRVFVFLKATFLAYTKLSLLERPDSSRAYILHNENTVGQPKKKNETCGLTNQVPQFTILPDSHPGFFLALFEQLSCRRKDLALDQKVWLYYFLAAGM